MGENRFVNYLGNVYLNHAIDTRGFMSLEFPSYNNRISADYFYFFVLFLSFLQRNVIESLNTFLMLSSEYLIFHM